MARTIEQKVVFKNTTPKVLYDLYMDPDQHSNIAGSPVEISDRTGSNFSAHGNYITGKTIHLVKNSLIVNISMPRCEGVPLPEDPYDSFPGLSLR